MEIDRFFVRSALRALFADEAVADELQLAYASTSLHRLVSFSAVGGG
jgi:hypothetical protein